MYRNRFESLTTRRGEKEGAGAAGYLRRNRPQVLVALAVVSVLLGGAFYASHISGSAPKTVYNAPLQEVAADAQPPVIVRINTATSEELQELPGIGPALAERIIEYRQTHGAFRSLEELENVSGIGPKTLEKIRPYADL
ncbi:helix-hairpin-helix domain-containing protein [Rubrobacter taiwanensis]|jgi:competence protein ComEA|uniref:Helix-hairpin-helix domain-containing protein n=1 Tax=Rubrobacter taiwanensis TaxID=185139 RepID=A0A4R1BJ03_9ACTN|nr:helix-hairpin-helix domain-containing protein [Rubrobacter taiwanensis]TCJ17325.1 helix-hairpin-helix domain-containing protein [Rubrobacter taiwanensis]